MTVSRSHTYTFTIYRTPSVDELIEELQFAKETLGGNAKVGVKSYDDQRDGSSVVFTVHG